MLLDQSYATLTKMVKRRAPVKIYLHSGICLTGRFVGYDAQCILLQNAHLPILIYKRHITTLMPDKDNVEQTDASSK